MATPDDFALVLSGASGAIDPTLFTMLVEAFHDRTSTYNTALIDNCNLVRAQRGIPSQKLAIHIGESVHLGLAGLRLKAFGECFDILHGRIGLGINKIVGGGTDSSALDD